MQILVSHRCCYRPSARCHPRAGIASIPINPTSSVRLGKSAGSPRWNRAPPQRKPPDLLSLSPRRCGLRHLRTPKPRAHLSACRHSQHQALPPHPFHPRRAGDRSRHRSDHWLCCRHQERRLLRQQRLPQRHQRRLRCTWRRRRRADRLPHGLYRRIRNLQSTTNPILIELVQRERATTRS